MATCPVTHIECPVECGGWRTAPSSCLKSPHRKNWDGHDTTAPAYPTPEATGLSYEEVRATQDHGANAD